MIATRDAYGEALAELGESNKDVVVLDADLSGSTKTAIFAKKFPERFFNIGIAEQDMMGDRCRPCCIWEDPVCLYIRNFCHWEGMGAGKAIHCLP